MLNIIILIVLIFIIIFYLCIVFENFDTCSTNDLSEDCLCETYKYLIDNQDSNSGGWRSQDSEYPNKVKFSIITDNTIDGYTGDDTKNMYTQCQKCPPGTQLTFSGCKKCEVNTYSIKENSWNCINCDKNMISNINRTKCINL